jgi:hypothetical protein
MSLLLLNASNYPSQPIYPYAFVQLGALARKHGVRFQCLDVLGLGPEERRRQVERAIRASAPDVIGVHLRQVDSVCFHDYVDGERGPQRYFPLEDTRDLIHDVRSFTDRPVVVGGFGFSVNPGPALGYLGADLGVVGEPDDFFSRFSDVASSRGGTGVANLIRPSESETPERRYYPPLGEREYDDSVVDALERFYGRSYLYCDAGPTVAVELARGCPYRCYFCTEPAVKGRAVSVRDLDVVMDEVAFLAGRGLRRVWLVCSELNMGNASLAREVAERFIRFNEARRGAPVRWKAYHLPRWLDEDDMQLLCRSGFEGGWNDFPSLSDPHLEQTRVPYRAKHARRHLEIVRAAHQQRAPDEGARLEPRFSIFFGNAMATPASIVESLLWLGRAGFDRFFSAAEVGLATRAFASHRGSMLEFDSMKQARTHRRDGGDPPLDLAHPTYFPPPLVADGCSLDDVRDFFRYAESTFLSTSYRGVDHLRSILVESAPRDWLLPHVRERARRFRLPVLDPSLAEEVERWLDELSRGSKDAFEALRHPRPSRLDAARITAVLVMRCLRSPPEPDYLRFLGDLGIGASPADTPEVSRFELFWTLLGRFDSLPSLESHVVSRLGVDPDGLGWWQARVMLADWNIRLSPAYRRVLRVDAAAASE